MDFGGTIRDARTSRGLSQSQVAGSLGVSTQYLSDMEMGRRPAPSRDDLIAKISESLSLPTDYLYFLSGRIPPDIYTSIAEGGEVQSKTVVRAFKTMRKQLNGHAS